MAQGASTTSTSKTESSMHSSSTTTTQSSSTSSSQSQGKEMRVSKGDRIRVDIQFKDGNKSQLKFLFEGKEIQEDKEGVRISVANDLASLIIDNADPQKHTGSYECIMDTKSGKASCKIFCRVI
eukprot:TRINITY_DN1084_c0_g1_i5.p2 TRINITY_DN1084_c0_g1~~TRINITY_DN1084_c0_g1_i5.p2  ORF type:complete len:124 (-),score=31.55 TRINITY_DN1084_c0_g1_i5:186-557(-)